MSIRGTLAKMAASFRQTVGGYGTYAYSMIGGFSRDAGVVVTQETALRQATVWSCVRVISESLSSIPWRVINTDEGQRTVASNHPVDTVLYYEANPEMASSTFVETIVSWALTWGNGFAEIERDMAGRVIALWPIHPSRVTVKRDFDSGRLFYEITNGAEREPTHIDYKNMFHLKGLGYDGIVGYSVISEHRTSVGLGLSMTETAAGLFGNYAVPSAIIKYVSRVDAKVSSDTRKEWNKLYAGPKNAGRIAVIGGDMSFLPLTMPMVDAQYIETRNFQVEEICRIFRVPPHKVQHLIRATFSNVEHLAIEYVQDTLMPWAVRLESEADRKLLGRNVRNRFQTQIDLTELLRGDSDARAKYYTQMRDLGVFTPNDILKKEGMSTIGPEGDRRLVPVNLMPLDMVGMNFNTEQPNGNDDPVPDEDNEDVELDSDEVEGVEAEDA